MAHSEMARQRGKELRIKATISSLPGGRVSLRISLEGRLSESHLGLVFLRLNPFLISDRMRSTMQSSFGGITPFLTGGGGGERWASDTRVHSNSSHMFGIANTVHSLKRRLSKLTYFSVLPLLSLGLFLCQLLLSLLGLGCQLFSGFVFLLSGKKEYHSLPSTKCTLEVLTVTF